jgi:hypothetical protein
MNGTTSVGIKSILECVNIDQSQVFILRNRIQLLDNFTFYGTLIETNI